MAQERLWATWRMPYISRAEAAKGCIFCDKPQENDDKKNLILYRGKNCFTIMNLYPYNNGHIMIVPYRHVSDITTLTYEETGEMMEQLKFFISAIKKAMNPEAFNSGINMGRPAGAGIADHLHMHLVPRWTGDSNFMPAVGDTRVISEHITDTYDKLLRAVKNEVEQ